MGGVTSALLSSSPEAATRARNLRLDLLFPVAGFKRYATDDAEFVYPAEWLQDQTLALRQAALRQARPVARHPGERASRIRDAVPPLRRRRCWIRRRWGAPAQRGGSAWSLRWASAPPAQTDLPM